MHCSRTAWREGGTEHIAPKLLTRPQNLFCLFLACVNKVYWTTQLLTWLLLPMTEATMSAGDFTLWAKLKSAMKEQVVVYASLLVVGVGVYLYLTFHEGMKQGQLKQTAMMASNMWGLFMVILLLGYGLVDVPRRLWRGTTTAYELRSMQFRASKLYAEIADATGAEEDNEDEIKTVASQISAGEPLRKYVDIILKQSHTAADVHEYTPSTTDDIVTQTSLTKLNRRLIKSRRVLNRCQCQWNALMDEIFEMEDVIKNKSATDRVFRATFGPQPRFPTLTWFWRVQLQPLVCRCAAVLAIMMSSLLLWSEISFRSTKPVLSIYALMVQHEGANLNYVGLEFVTFLTLVYLCLCTYSPIFRIRLFDFYYLVPNQQTDSSSMLFSAMIMSRLTAPLCLNFLGMTHLDSHISNRTEVYSPRNQNVTLLKQETAFTTVQGHMDLFTQVNAYYSVVVIFVGICVLLRVGNRILSLCGVQRFVDDDEDTQEMVTEGKALVQRERRRRERSGNARMSLSSSSSARENMFREPGTLSKTREREPHQNWDRNQDHDLDREGNGGRNRPNSFKSRIGTPSRTGLIGKRTLASDDDTLMESWDDGGAASNSLADDIDMSAEFSRQGKKHLAPSFGSLFGRGATKEDADDNVALIQQKDGRRGNHQRRGVLDGI